MFRFLISVISLLALVTIAVFGPWHFFGMDMKDEGTMKGCLFTDNVMLCKMDILEHISLWQNMLTATPVKTVLLILGIAALIVLVLRDRFAYLLFRKQTSLLKRLATFDNSSLLIFNPLKRAFSKGILHPKIFSF